MGGHAFRSLYCPRIPREDYLKVREQTRNALQKLFKNVAVATEMPSKTDYGDIDFLVSDFVHTAPGAKLDWERMVDEVKEAFHTVHGRRGILTPDNMYFAVKAPGHEKENFWVQVDLRVCEPADVENFNWTLFQLHYASGMKIMGSLMKPLGLTIDPTGIHIRVEEMEATNFPGSLVFVSKDPADVLKILCVDKRWLFAAFDNNEEVYKYLAASWIFNPEHFEARLEDEKYQTHLENRSAAWTHFVTEWIPEHYPVYRMPDQDIPLDEWRKQVRTALREKVFTLFPAITPEFYAKRAAHLKEVEEVRLQQMLMKVIPEGLDGWRDDFPKPAVIVNDSTLAVSSEKPNIAAQVEKTTIRRNSLLTPSGAIIEYPDTPPESPPSSVKDLDIGNAATASFTVSSEDALSTPLYLQPLPRTPPLPFVARPPQRNMSIGSKLLCMARWTYFDAQTGMPYLGHEAREKKFEMCWSDSGVSDEVLIKWVREMWWGVWMRQVWTNYVGMWKKRFEKDDAKAAKVKREEAAKETVEMETVQVKEAHVEKVVIQKVEMEKIDTKMAELEIAHTEKVDKENADVKRVEIEQGRAKILERLSRVNAM